LFGLVCLGSIEFMSRFALFLLFFFVCQSAYGNVHFEGVTSHAATIQIGEFVAYDAAGNTATVTQRIVVSFVAVEL